MRRTRPSSTRSRARSEELRKPPPRQPWMGVRTVTAATRRMRIPEIVVADSACEEKYNPALRFECLTYRENAPRAPRRTAAWKHAKNLDAIVPRKTMRRRVMTTIDCSSHSGSPPSTVRVPDRNQPRGTLLRFVPVAHLRDGSRTVYPPQLLKLQIRYRLHRVE